MFKKKLSFHKFADAKECPICLNANLCFVGHPSGCAHMMCVDCIKAAYWPERGLFFDIRQYGFETNCECEFCNDDKSKPCSNAIDDWRLADDGLYILYLAEQARLQEGMDMKPENDPKICLLCIKSTLDVVKSP